jgi:hypothetical protein
MSIYDEDDQARDTLPNDLESAIVRHFPSDGQPSYSSDKALIVLARLLPHIDDTDDVLATVFPNDGPHSRDTVIDAASAISKLVRYLNNATQPGTARRTLEWANTIDSIISNIKAAVHGLDQLFDQLGAAATAAAADPTIYDAESGRLTPAEKSSTADIREARRKAGAQSARHLADLLQQMRPAVVVTEGWRVTGGLARQLEDAHSVSVRLGNN